MLTFKRKTKKFAFLLVVSMLATMFVGLGSASAASTNTVISVPVVSSTSSGIQLGDIWIAEDDSQHGTVFVPNKPIDITVTIVTGDVEFDTTNQSVASYATAVTSGAYDKNAVKNSDITFVGSVAKKTHTIRVDPTTGGTGRSAIALHFPVVLSGANNGPVEVRIDASGTSVTEGTYTIATVATKGTVAKVLDTTTLQTGSSGVAGLLRIEEAVAGSITGSSTQIRLDLPAEIDWNVDTTAANSDIQFVGFTSVTPRITTSSAGASRLVLDVVDDGNSAPLGMITIDPRVTVNDEFGTGDIVVSISGNNSDVSSASVTIGSVADYGISVEAIGDPTTVVAGALDTGLADFRVKEEVSGSLLGNRNITIELPSYARWFTGPQVTVEKGTGSLNGPSPAEATTDTARHIKRFTLNSTTTNATTFKFERNRIYLDADAPEGDLVAVVSGSSLNKDYEVVLGTVVRPVAAAADSTPDMIIGVSEQKVGNLVITENVKGAFHGNPTVINYKEYQSSGNTIKATSKDSATTVPNNVGYIVVKAPNGVTFAKKPTVSVDGNLKIDAESLRLANNDTEVSIRVNTASTSPSTITLSDIVLTLDRTVPEGDLKLQVSGTSVDRTSEDNDVVVADAVVAKVITPAPSDVSNKVSLFTIGSTTYTVNGVDMTMDVAPYIKDSRTYMPVRFVAYALGVGNAALGASDPAIIWDDINRTVTLTKEGKVVQLKIGSNEMLMNGAVVTMDVSPEIVNGRTMLPASWVASAFGYTASWDAATQQVTIQVAN